VKKHYLGKLKKGGFPLEDPFAIEDEQWSEDLTKWPEVEHGDIHNYLIETKGIYTQEKLKAYKFLDAFNYYINGYVRTVYHLSRGGHSDPSPKTADKTHEAWVLVEKIGTVLTGHYACIAG